MTVHAVVGGCIDAAAPASLESPLLVVGDAPLVVVEQRAGAGPQVVDAAPQIVDESLAVEAHLIALVTSPIEHHLHYLQFRQSRDITCSKYPLMQAIVCNFQSFGAGAGLLGWSRSQKITKFRLRRHYKGRRIK